MADDRPDEADAPDEAPTPDEAAATAGAGQTLEPPVERSEDELKPTQGHPGRRHPTLRHDIRFRDILKPLMVTFKQMVTATISRPATVLYPWESLPVPKRFRGMHQIDWDLCIGCSICAKVCPNQCITMEKLPVDVVGEEVLDEGDLIGGRSELTGSGLEPRGTPELTQGEVGDDEGADGDEAGNGNGNGNGDGNGNGEGNGHIEYTGPVRAVLDERKDQMERPGVDIGHCLFCGFCGEYCPTDAYQFTNEFELADTDRDAIIYSAQEVRKPGTGWKDEVALVNDLHEQPVFIKNECTGCVMCFRVCPTQCIKMVEVEGWPGRKRGKLEEPRFDFDRCIGCSKCVEACHFDALRMETVGQPLKAGEQFAHLTGTETVLDES